MSDDALRGTLLDERLRYSMTEFCRICGGDEDWVVALVGEGILEPAGTGPDAWHFEGWAVQRAIKAKRLQQDFDLDIAGLALVLELLDEIGSLRAQLRIAGTPV